MNRDIRFRIWNKKDCDFITDYDTGDDSLVEFYNDGKFRVVQTVLTCHCNPDAGC